MSDRIYLGRNMRSFHSSPEFDGFSKVTIIVSDEIEYSAGSDAGRTLTLPCPWGTPEMAENILRDIQGFQYQPYTADNAIIDPAAELGDGVTANNVYGGIYTKRMKFGPLLTATVSAPEDEEINHEYPYRSKPNREIIRQAKLLRASLKIEAERITQEVTDRTNAVEELTAQLKIQAGVVEAKVSKTGGDASTFGWELLDSSWTVKGNGQDIFKVTKDGAEVTGKITAKEGDIGDFRIADGALSSNNHTWGGTNTNGVYVGPSGIQLGKKFKVDYSGKLYAESGTFAGTIYAGNIVAGQDSVTGENYGYLSGSGISTGSIYGDRMVANTISTAYTSTGINLSLGRADYAYNVFSGISTAESVLSKNVTATNKCSCKKLYIDGASVTKKSVTFKDGSGNNVTIAYWG